MELLQVSKRKDNVEQQLQSIDKIKEDNNLLKQREGGFKILGFEKNKQMNLKPNL